MSDIYTPEEWEQIQEMFDKRKGGKEMIKLHVIRHKNLGGGHYLLQQYAQLDGGKLVEGQKVYFRNEQEDRTIFAEIIENDYRVLVVRELTDL
jgi:hypothetical protein